MCCLQQLSMQGKHNADKAKVPIHPQKQKTKKEKPPNGDSNIWS